MGRKRVVLGRKGLLIVVLGGIEDAEDVCVCDMQGTNMEEAAAALLPGMG